MGFADFLWLLIFAWLAVFLLHQVIGGLLGIFYRGMRRRNAIEIVNAKNKK